MPERRASLVERRLRARRGRVPPRAEYPHGEQLSYQLQLEAILKQINALVDEQLMSQLPRILERARTERSVPLAMPRPQAIRTFAAEHRLDAASDDVGTIADRVRQVIGQLVSEGRLQVTTSDVFQKVATQNRRQITNQMKQLIGVDLYVREPWITTASKAFVRENVQLIRTMTRAQIDRTERIALEGVRRGLRHEEIRDQLVKMRGVSDRQAALIARDQVGKANAELTKLRQTALGVTHYIWRTVGDDAVRDEHEAREGQRFSWDDPPEDGHPGEPINCRCTAEPVFDGLLEAGSVG